MKPIFMRCMVVLASMLFLVGCPIGLQPRLVVQPGSLTLNETKLSDHFSITNSGNGTLQWTVTSHVPWLLLSLEEGIQKSSVSGETATNVLVRVHLIKDELPPEIEDSLRTELTVESNGGNEIISVAVTRQITPELSVEPATVDFGDVETEKTVELVNRGRATLLWNVTVPASIGWLTITPTSGTISGTGAQAMTLTVNRSKLAPSTVPYTASIDIDSNGGKKTITISVLATAFTASPLTLDFGLLREPSTQSVIVKTFSRDPVILTCTVTLKADVNWLSVEPRQIEITKSRPGELRVSANPVGLAPGLYTGSVVVSHAGTGRVVPVAVTMEVGQPITFRVEPPAVDFGDIRVPTQKKVLLVNESAQTVDWRFEKPTSATWLSATPDSGVLEGSAEVTLTINPLNVKIGPLSANVTFWAGGSSQIVRVTANRIADPIPDKLEVEPRERDFGALLNKMEINLWNEGPSRINWTIDTTTLPQWLRVDPSSGFVEGAITQTVQLTVDRSVAPDQRSFSHMLRIQPSGAGDLQPVEVVIKAQQRMFPDIAVEGDGVDAEGTPFLLIDIGQDTRSFIIRNNGKADLNWNVNQQNKPAWITAISPLQGLVAPGRQISVAVTTNRSGLDQFGGVYKLPIESNDPDTSIVLVEVQVRVPFTITIGTSPNQLNFGRNLSTLDFAVANFGDPGWPLDFVITTNQPDWVFVEPSRGRSIGRSSGVDKDWRVISVAIDRERISGTGASARLIVSAENVPPNAAPVTPVEVQISVDVAELTIETALPRFRPPSLLRFNMLLRDSRQRVFPDFLDNLLDNRTLSRIGGINVDILEDSMPIDLSETTVLIKKDETLSFSVLIILDFSASMAEAAQDLVDDGQLNPGTLKPLEALYIETVGAMLDAFPSHYKVALAVFNERRPFWESNLRIIRGAPTGYSLKDSYESFTSNKAIQRYRLTNMDVRDAGATPLYSSLLEGTLHLYYLDSTLPDFDATANRILIPITDGRRTTPPGELTELLDVLEATRIRVFPIGWGKNVYANPLIQMSTKSGGHYYATRNKVVPGAVDLDGNPLTIPIKANLLDRCRPNPDDPNIASVPKDLSAHVVISYPTLNEEEAVEIQTRVEVTTVLPSVKETAIFKQVPALSFANDVRLGQIGMRTNGIKPDGSATVTFYADYMPRSITRLVFELETDPIVDWIPVLVPMEQGGLVADWELSRVGNRVTLQSGTGRPLTYGDYGNLFDVNVTGAGATFDLKVTTIEPVITGHPDSKYFTIPQKITVTGTPSGAVSFPNPDFVFTPPALSEISNIFNIGSLELLPLEDENLRIQIRNIGGEHLPTNAALYWKLQSTQGYLPGTRPATVEFVYNGPEPVGTEYYLIYDADECLIVPTNIYDDMGNLIAEPGVYSIEFYIDVYYGSLGYEFSHGPYYLRFEIP